MAEVEAGQIAYLTRAGQPVAALVPVSELAQLQQVYLVGQLPPARRR